MMEEVRYYAQELLRLSNRRQTVLDEMVTFARPLPEYEILLSIHGIAETTTTSIIGELGDIRRFRSANQINAFSGVFKKENLPWKGKRKPNRNKEMWGKQAFRRGIRERAELYLTFDREFGHSKMIAKKGIFETVGSE